MKRIQTGVVCLLVLMMCSFSGVSAQIVEDLLRFSTPGLGIGARSLGMGTSALTTANDFSATYWNPAGLGLMNMNELSLGLSHYGYSGESNFLNNGQSLNNSSTSLNGLGLVYAVPTVRGSLVIAIGYGRESDYTTGLSWQGFNPNSSIIQTWAPDGARYPNDLSTNIAYQLYLANLDTLNSTWISSIRDSVTQSGKTLEGGGLNYVVVSGAVEAARNLYLGATLMFVTGSYTYAHNYYEKDLNNRAYPPAEAPFDFTSLSLQRTIDDDLSGFSMKLGLLYQVSPRTRFALAVKTPTWMTVRETYSEEARSEFDNGDTYVYPLDPVRIKNDYDIQTPYIFSGGLSFNSKWVTLSGDVEYTDWTQMEFRNPDAYLFDRNTQVKEVYRPTVNFRLGAEAGIPHTDFCVRAGFAYLPSPYEGDPASFAQKYVTAGIGLIIQNAVGIDVGFAHGFRDSFINNDDPTSTIDEIITTNSLIATMSYRF